MPGVDWRSSSSSVLDEPATVSSDRTPSMDWCTTCRLVLWHSLDAIVCLLCDCLRFLQRQERHNNLPHDLPNDLYNRYWHEHRFLYDNRHFFRHLDWYWYMELLGRSYKHIYWHL